MRSTILSIALASIAFAQTGIFDGRSDIGALPKPGVAEYDAAAKTYRISAGGENIWGTADHLHYVWKRVSEDVSLTADIAFATATGDPHKKAVLMFRQSLDADSAYADAAVHADGLTSLQARDEKGAATHEIQANVSKPKRVRITKAGSYFYLSIAGNDAPMRLAGGSMKVDLKPPFYVGIGVSAHNKENIETGIFSNVEIAPAPKAAGQPKLYSTLETITVSSTDRRAVYTAEGRFEAPNWTKDNQLVFNGGGRLYRIPVTGGTPAVIDTGFATRINNDHVLSPDGA